jgi:hypothetical protein
MSHCTMMALFQIFLSTASAPVLPKTVATVASAKGANVLLSLHTATIFKSNKTKTVSINGRTCKGTDFQHALNSDQESLNLILRRGRWMRYCGTAVPEWKGKRRPGGGRLAGFRHHISKRKEASLRTWISRLHDQLVPPSTTTPPSSSSSHFCFFA